MMDATVSNIGVSPMMPEWSTYQYSGALATMNGLSIPTKFNRWAFIGWAKRMEVDTTKSVFRFSYAGYQSGMHSDDRIQTTGTLTNLGTVDGLDNTVYTNMDSTSEPKIAAITWIIAMFCDNKTILQASDYFESKYDQFLENYTSGGFIEG
ncbi:MAG: hypothetical protein PHE53_14225 [Thermoguttaceae bacterium]|nr:hypothetical protein [Thermoguttaceae bacterium]